MADPSDTVLRRQPPLHHDDSDSSTHRSIPTTVPLKSGGIQGGLTVIQVRSCAVAPPCTESAESNVVRHGHITRIHGEDRANDPVHGFGKHLGRGVVKLRCSIHPEGGADEWHSTAAQLNLAVWRAGYISRRQRDRNQARACGGRILCGRPPRRRLLQHAPADVRRRCRHCGDGLQGGVASACHVGVCPWKTGDCACPRCRSHALSV